MLFGTGTRKLKKQPNRNTKATAQQRPNYSRPPKGQKPKRRPKSPNKNNPKRPRLKIPQIKFPKLPKIGTRKRPKYLKSKRPVKQRPNHQTVILLTDPTQSTPTGSKYQSSPTLAPPLPPPSAYSSTTATTTTTTSTSVYDSYGAPKAEPASAYLAPATTTTSVYDSYESPKAEPASAYKAPATTAPDLPSQSETSSVQPSYLKYETPIPLPTFYSPPKPTIYDPVPYQSTSSTYVAPFLQPEVTNQVAQKSQTKRLVDSYGAPVKYPDSILGYDQNSPASVDSYGAPKAEPEKTKATSYQVPQSQYSMPTDSYAAKPSSYSPPNIIDSYAAKPASAPAPAQYRPPIQNVDSYGAPKAESIKSYSKPDYSAPTTTPCPPNEHAFQGSGYPDFSDFSKPLFQFTSGFEPGNLYFKLLY